MCYVSEKDKSLVALTERVIHVVGPRRMQNELLASFLQQKTWAKCLSVEHVCDSQVLDDYCSEPQRLVLLDCLEKDAESLLVELKSLDEKVFSENLVALFNLRPYLKIEREAVAWGVRGFFYIDDALEQIQKGVRAVFGGELWLAREIMTTLVLGNNNSREFLERNAKVLTSREIDVLEMLTWGAKNTEIASKLCISPNTVKGHLYNIYKKIGVSNRLEATLWVTNRVGAI